MDRRISLALVSHLALAAAACGDDGLRVGGTFAEAGDAPMLVWASEAEREARVEDGAFAFDGLAPGPVTLVVRSEGRDLGRIELRELVEAGAVELEELRIDRASGRAFPGAVRLDGPRRVTINGVRYGGALPAQVAADGVVLAVSHGDGAMLFRPAGGEMPDLRVVFDASVIGADHVVRPIAAGDSARVEGTVQDGYVVASRISPPGDLTPADSPATTADAEERAGDAEPTASPAAAAPVAARAVSPAPARPQVREPPPGRGREKPGRGGGRGREKKPKKG